MIVTVRLSPLSTDIPPQCEWQLLHLRAIRGWTHSVKNEALVLDPVAIFFICGWSILGIQILKICWADGI